MDQRNFQFLCYGLIAAWALVAVYLVVLAGRGSKLRQELDRVKRMMEDREGAR
jgi:CcmD family protein